MPAKRNTSWVDAINRKEGNMSETVDRSKVGFEILQAGIVLGLICDFLLRVTPWGLNLTAITLFMTVAIVALSRRHSISLLNANTAALLSALAIIGLFFSWRDSDELKVLDILAAILIFAILVLPALRLKIERSGLFHYAAAMIWAAFSAAFGPFLLIFNDIKWASVARTGWRKHMVAVMRGAAIAAPLLFIFGALFVAADAVFEGFIEKTLNIRPDILIQHTVMISFFAWVSAGYLRAVTAPGVLAGNDSNEPAAAGTENQNQTNDTGWDWRAPDNSILPGALTLGPIEIGVSMGLINLLFGVFVVFQIPYLFGGFDLVQNTADLKLADYARRGFGELVAVAALVLPILMVSHWLIRRESSAAEKIYRVMAGIQIGLLFVIMASAAQRLFVLTGSLGYGLTTVRFYPLVFMGWLALIFIWFAVTVLRGLRNRFAWGALWSALIVLGALHFLNPDDFIVRTNVRLMNQGRPFDAHYNTSLSADAVPALLNAFPSITAATMDPNRQQVFDGLRRKYCDLQKDKDLRSWNLARTEAIWKFKSDEKWSELGNCDVVESDHFR